MEANPQSLWLAMVIYNFAFWVCFDRSSIQAAD